MTGVLAQLVEFEGEHGDRTCLQAHDGAHGHQRIRQVAKYAGVALALVDTAEVRDTVAARFQHPSPVLLFGGDATKQRLQQVHGPQFLHLGSHCYFDPSVCSNHPSDELRNDPLLRLGIALAGANARTSGDDRGLLTAKETSGLDLYGTRLVVLSACESGVGQAEAGDGVYGLRRALLLAGAETQAPMRAEFFGTLQRALPPDRLRAFGEMVRACVDPAVWTDSLRARPRPRAAGRGPLVMSLGPALGD